MASARQIRQLIAGLNANGTTILLTTHYIEEAERLCGRIAFIVQGRIVRTDSVETLMRETQGRHIVEFGVSKRADALCAAIRHTFPALECAMVTSTALRVESQDPVRIGPLVRLIEDRGEEVSEARKIRPSLEDIFVHVTGIEAKILKQECEKRGKGGGA